ncbi:S41 family peptidase [Haematospirillum jordaniae]|uniref:Uncharacterized protein n=1 Tax=Haematospirillum jordaniae TaxID=1549855 RepID=A0A143DF00_9PROT|nr:S41 family peptidase [Haematospirillum jordaniae]AMW35315.1 hypothetical protein AY555_09165 [Haematospirillum jordaniae]NKD56269.1 S41 family peptidase [Haematospirillum jordaniae]NKD58326.1 S41 family peptidase [Haematospirillum jordaniae]NKD66505.1 S41 family peptidase [Haematospirillum jordaniae]NKD78329.1 S41 family peptidase [Haematospirillum jordaniae]
MTKRTGEQLEQTYPMPVTMHCRSRTPSKLAWILGIVMVLTQISVTCYASPVSLEGQPPVEGHDQEDMVRVISYGLDVIAARSLEPAEINTIAQDGLHGVIAMDHDLKLRAENNWLHLHQKDTPIGAFAMPTQKDPTAWGHLVVNVIAHAGQISPHIQMTKPEPLYRALFGAILSHLDPFSRYASPEEAAEQRANRSGYGGIGMRYQIMGDHLLVLDVQPDTPAELSGLLKGDQITRIGNTDLSDIKGNQEHIARYIRGLVRSPVRLKVERNGLSRDINIKPGLAAVQTVDAQLAEDAVPIIHIRYFSQDTAEKLAGFIHEAKRKNKGLLKGLILDLRGNPGGLLDQAVECAGLFVSSGRLLSTLGRHPESVQRYSTDGRDIMDGRPIVVLLDERSASAAEILGAALQDKGRALVVGTSTYGKGTVQTIIRLPNNGELTLTWSRLHTPAGYSLNKLGVMPTLCTSTLRFGNIQPLQTLGGNIDATTAIAARWRTVGLTDREGRESLRSLCPPEGHGGRYGDILVAKDLIHNSALYKDITAAIMMPPPPLSYH